MPSRYRDDPLTSEGDTLLPKSEKRVSFDPELEDLELQRAKRRQKKRTTRRIHVFGLILLILGLLFYSNGRRPPHHRYLPSPADMATDDAKPNCETASFPFDDPSHFSLDEILDNQGYIGLDIRGSISLTSQCTGNQTAALIAYVSMESHNIDIASTNFATTPTSLTIGNPELKNRSFFRRPTLTLTIHLVVKPGTNLTTLHTQTRHLHISIHDSLSLTVTDRTTLSAISGHITTSSAQQHPHQRLRTAPPHEFHSRETYLSSVSGGIRGAYALEDVLSCTTTSGGVRIHVTPRPAGKVVVPARFVAETVSGHCGVVFVTDDKVPEREYFVDVKSGSGGIDGTYVHGKGTRVESGSGSIKVEVVPYGGGGESELVTVGGSGSTSVFVLGALTGNGTLGALRSEHRGVSGSLRLRYPVEWKGNFEGSSVSGSLGVEGEGLEVEHRGGPGLKTVSGKTKVEGAAELKFSTVSGSARLVVGGANEAE